MDKRTLIKTAFFALVFVGFYSFIFADEARLEQDKAKGLGYVQGEVLVKFKQGIVPQEAIKSAGIVCKNIERVYSIEPVVAKFKKNQKFEKSSDGWYWYLGKKYKRTEEIPDQEIFEDAFKGMGSEEKSLYQTYKIDLSEGTLSVEEAIKRLIALAEVEYAEPNYIAQIQMIPNDPDFHNQWGLPRIKMPEAWDITQGRYLDGINKDKPVIVAVVDTGVDYRHPDLTSNIWLNEDEISGNNLDDDLNGYRDDYYGYNFYNNTSNPMDLNGHGTHCAGIIAAIGNTEGIIGVSPLAKVMALKNMSNESFGSVTAAVNAVRYAVDNGAKVINNSYSFSSSVNALTDAFTYAQDRGVICVAAAGNQNTDVGTRSPANIDTVLAISSINRQSLFYFGSNSGEKIALAAPGDDILSTFPNNRYVYQDGTSMAAPHVAGVAALIISQNPQLSVNQIRQLMQITAEDIGDPGKDIYFGYGIVNAYSALAMGKIYCSIVTPGQGSFVRGNRVEIRGSAFIQNGFKEYNLFFAPKNKPEGAIAIFDPAIAARVEAGVLGIWDTSGCSDGEYTLSLKVFNTENKSITYSINLTIDNQNSNLTNKTAVIGRPFEFSLIASNVLDELNYWNNLQYCATNLPAHAQFNPQTKVFSWQPGTVDKGSWPVKFSISGNDFAITKEIILSTLAIEEAAVTVASGLENFPGIYSNKVIWEDNRNSPPGPYSASNKDIYGYDLAVSGSELSIVTAIGDQISPDIYGNKITWADYRNGNADIYMRDLDLAVNQEISIATHLSDQTSPAIYGNKIAWADYRNGNVDIYMRDLDLIGNQESAVITEAHEQNFPAIYNDKIAWEDWRNGSLDIYMLKRGSEIKITKYPKQPGTAAFFQSRYHFALSDDKVVWEDLRNGNQDIYMYDIATAEEMPLTTASGIQGYPDIYRDRVAWHDARNGNFDIYLYDLANRQEIQITNDLSDEVMPAIFGNKIAWADYRNGNADIYLAKLIYAPQIIPANPLVVLLGKTFTIKGRDFGDPQGESRVLFSNGVSATVISWSDTSITCSVPLNAQPGLLTVVTLGGPSNGVRIKFGGELQGTVYGEQVQRFGRWSFIVYKPLAGVKITVVHGQRIIQSTITEINGSYRVNNLAEGLYIVAAAKAGYKFRIATVKVSVNSERPAQCNFLLRKL